jgi:hypothetical protein
MSLLRHPVVTRRDRSPWFTAVVTDYDEATNMHVLTYQFGTVREEREDVRLGDLAPEVVQVRVAGAVMLPVVQCSLSGTRWKTTPTL